MSDDVKKKKKKKGLVKSDAPDLKLKKKKLKSKDVVEDTGVKKKKKKDKEGMHDYGREVRNGADEGKKKKKKDVAKAEDAPKVMLPVEQDDYIIVKVGKKNKLAFAHSPKRNTCYIEETMSTDEPVTFEYDASTLVANLGKEPQPGKVFGVEIMPHYGAEETPMGMMHLYRKLNDAEKNAIAIGIKKAVKAVKEIELEKVFPITRLEVHNPRGKWAGSYQVSFKSGEAVDLMKIMAKILEDQIYNKYIFLHETGHAIWYRYVPEKVRAEWLEKYNSMTTVSKAKKADMEQLCQSLISSQLSVRDFQRDLEEDELGMFKEALGYLKKVHKMSPEDANVLLNQNSKVLAEIWPTSASISNSDSLSAQLGEYAATNVQEMFAEAFAFHLTGKQLPKSILKLMEKTLKAARSNE